MSVHLKSAFCTGPLLTHFNPFWQIAVIWCCLHVRLGKCVSTTTFRPNILYTADGLLRVADFQVVYEHLYPVRLHWRPIGDRLGLNPSDLENYEDEYRKNDQRLRKVILEWLRQRNLRPTWKALIEALSHQTVGEEGAAHDLQEFVMPGAKPG